MLTKYTFIIIVQGILTILERTIMKEDFKFKDVFTFSNLYMPIVGVMSFFLVLAFLSSKPLPSHTKPVSEPQPIKVVIEKKEEQPKKIFEEAKPVAKVEHPKPKRIVHPTDSEVQCLAEAIYYEARGDVLRGKLAVADVVLNRTKSSHFPNDVCKVVYQKGQFSWTKNKYKIKEYKAWEDCQRIAREKLTKYYLNTRVDVTSNSTFFSTGYHHKNTVKVAKIGAHTFFKMIQK